MMKVRAAAEAVAAAEAGTAAACGDVAGMVARCRRQGVSAAAAAVECATAIVGVSVSAAAAAAACATAIVATRRHVDLRR